MTYEEYLETAKVYKFYPLDKEQWEKNEAEYSKKRRHITKNIKTRW